MPSPSARFGLEVPWDAQSWAPSGLGGGWRAGSGEQGTPLTPPFDTKVPWVLKGGAQVVNPVWVKRARAVEWEQKQTVRSWKWEIGTSWV